MRKLLILILGLAVTSAVTYAGEDTGNNKGKHHGGDRMARMQENLGLSDEQVEQIRHIRETGGSREDMRAVFTEEQRALMKEHRGQSHGGKKSHGKRHGRHGKDHDGYGQDHSGEQDSSVDNPEGN